MTGSDQVYTIKEIVLALIIGYDIGVAVSLAFIMRYDIREWWTHRRRSWR